MYIIFNKEYVHTFHTATLPFYTRWGRFFNELTTSHAHFADSLRSVIVQSLFSQGNKLILQNQ